MYRINVISFRIYEDSENYIYDLKEQIELLIADTPHWKRTVIKEVENEEEAKRIFNEEKEKIMTTKYNRKEECYIGEELILTEVEEEGIFKGNDAVDPIETYIKYDEN